MILVNDTFSSRAVIVRAVRGRRSGAGMGINEPPGNFSPAVQTMRMRIGLSAQILRK
jgi:hypothetical protein